VTAEGGQPHTFEPPEAGRVVCRLTPGKVISQQTPYARWVSSEPTSQSEPETTPEEYRQRALLMADLGRYDEAVGEIALGLAAAPDDAALLSTLARVHIAAAQPADALAAAERAAASAPGTIGPLVVRAMALSDERRFGEAAQVAASILGSWPADPYAQRTGAALLSEARNGQDALNAAWNGVRLTPADAEAHLVLAVVAARLRLFDLAQRAYGEALDLDATIGDAQSDVGVVRLERRRWAQALESLADAAIPEPTPADPIPTDPGPPDPDSADSDSAGPGRAAPGPAESESAASSPAVVPPAVVPPRGPVLDRSSAVADTFRQAVLYGSNGTLVAAVLAAVMTNASTGVARAWGGVIGVVVVVAVLVWLNRALPVPVGTGLHEIRGSGRLVAAVYATALAPFGLVAFAVVGGVAPLIAAMLLAAFAELVVLTQRS
jgi:tetratricopeptide (TPR) repeat protein